MSEEGHVCACGQPAPDTTICQHCEDRLTRALGDVSALDEELQTVLSKQTKAGGTHVGFVTSTPTRPLPFDTKASEIGGALRAILVSWVRLVDEEAIAPPLPRNTLPALARWLLGQVGWLRLYPAGDDAVDEIVGAVDAVRRVVMRQPPERHYRGPCRTEWQPTEDAVAICIAELYARGLHVEAVICSQCGARHESTERRDWLLAEASARTYTQTELATLLQHLLDRPVPRPTIASWIRRNRLVAHGTNLDGQPLYLIGDALDLVAPEHRQRSA